MYSDNNFSFSFIILMSFFLAVDGHMCLRGQPEGPISTWWSGQSMGFGSGPGGFKSGCVQKHHVWFFLFLIMAGAVFFLENGHTRNCRYNR